MLDTRARTELPSSLQSRTGCAVTACRAGLYTYFPRGRSPPCVFPPQDLARVSLFFWENPSVLNAVRLERTATLADPPALAECVTFMSCLHRYFYKAHSIVRRKIITKQANTYWLKESWLLSRTWHRKSIGEAPSVLDHIHS